jgi:Predicted 3'-5' exonuclease related to the exonuclease domain of PolB
MRNIFLDIETLPPDTECFAATEDLETCDDKEFRDLALKAEKGRLLTIGVIVEENGVVTKQGLFGRDRETGDFHLDEAKTLHSFWQMVGKVNPNCDLFIGHNILDFDLPFLIKKSIINRIKPPEISFRRYQVRPIFDTMWQWSLWHHRISMDNVAEALGVQSSKDGDIDGSKVYDYFMANKHQEIALYCMRDVECAREIYYRLNFQTAPLLIPYQSDKKFLAAPSANLSLAIAV